MTAIARTGRLCVFLGSGTGSLPRYAQAARDFGHLLARRGIGLVPGGGSLGLMGQVAARACEEGGAVIGVIPEALPEAFTNYRHPPVTPCIDREEI